MQQIKTKLVFGVLILSVIFSCKKDDTDIPGELPPINNSSIVEGYSILNKLSGIWNGPVYSPTPLGDFAEWIVDFRPISPSQVSAKNELDSVNDIFMSFFICKYDNKYKIAFRNGGGFAGSVRNSYMMIDSLYEDSSKSFYRFVDPISGGNRVYTDITFKQDSLIMHSFTNLYNTLPAPETHMKWTAKLKDTTSAQEAISIFNFPQKELTIDFSNTFDNFSEAVFYSESSDPYPEEEQPYLGNSIVNITISEPTTIDNNKKVIIIITTQPLFNGNVFIPENLDFRSRYVFMGSNNSIAYNFNYMHPGTYYANAIYDSNGDLNFSSGDYINSLLDVPFTLTNKGTATVNIDIDFQIP